MFVWNHQSDEDVRQIVQSSWKPMLRNKVSWETNKNGNQCWEPKSVWWKHMETKPKLVSPSLNKTMKIFGKFWKPKCWEPPPSHEKKDHEPGKSMDGQSDGRSIFDSCVAHFMGPRGFPKPRNCLCPRDFSWAGCNPNDAHQNTSVATMFGVCICM